MEISTNSLSISSYNDNTDNLQQSNDQKIKDIANQLKQNSLMAAKGVPAVQKCARESALVRLFGTSAYLESFSKWMGEETGNMNDYVFVYEKEKLTEINLERNNTQLLAMNPSQLAAVEELIGKIRQAKEDEYNQSYRGRLISSASSLADAFLNGCGPNRKDI